MTRCGGESPSDAFPDEMQELGSRGGSRAKGAEHGARADEGVLLFDPSHRHAKMQGFDNHCDAPGFELLVEARGDLAGKAFLNLQTTTE